MNYLKELRAFYDYVLYNGVSTGEVALWYTLMSINNRLGWLDEFAVSNLVLQQATSLSRNGLNSARNGLKQKGLIDYRPGKSNQAGKYRLISFECNILCTPVCTNPDDLVTQNQTTLVQVEGTLTKRKPKHKQNTPIAPFSAKTEDEQSKTQTLRSICDQYAEDGPVRDALDGFVEMRKKDKKGFTVRALQLSLKKLDNLSAPYGDRAEEAKAAILDQSVQRGWAGLFDLKEPLPEKAPVIHHEEMPKPLTADEARTRSLEDLLG